MSSLTSSNKNSNREKNKVEEKVSPATTIVDFTAAPLKEHRTIHLLGYWYFFFHSKVPGYPEYRITVTGLFKSSQ